MTAPAPESSSVVTLRAAGCALVVDVGADGLLPRVLHWGADPGPVTSTAVVATGRPVPRSSLDQPRQLRLLAQEGDGFLGRPGLVAARGGRAVFPRFATLSCASPPDAAGAEALDVVAVDEGAGLSLRTELRMAPSGVLRVRHVLRNDSADPEPLDVHELGVALPLPDPALEVLDLTGRWCRERSPQRRLLGQGSWVRSGRHGRTGHDATLLMVAGTPGFANRSGEVWAVHLGWSGDHAHWAERTPDGTGVLGAAELLRAGEVRIGRGEEYATPWCYAGWSAGGLDGLSAAFHRYQRARPHHPRAPRPVTLNTWEAVYFDHDLTRLQRLADTAAACGFERFVLDDGWFRHRRHERAGLGDWFVDDAVWPDGLLPLADHVHGLGMQVGLWVEPEMVNPDSDLFRAHPDWVLSPPGRLPPLWRHQLVLDLGNADASAYLLERLDSLVHDIGVDYLKWDHNRDLTEAGHDGRAAVHAQTLAVYALLDELRVRHPALEIESCASGGARVDLGILERTDRVWASDTNDALERQSIQRWTSLLLAPELVGAHVGPPTSHTTGRTHTTAFRLATAVFGHFGAEWDIEGATDDERAELAAAVAFHRSVRGVLHGGTVVRADHPDPSAWVHGVVGDEEAVFAYVQLATGTAEVPPRLRLPGLAPERTYRVEPAPVSGVATGPQIAPPDWLADGGVSLSGRALATVGLAVPLMNPETALLLHLRVTG